VKQEKIFQFFFKRGPIGCDWENFGAPEYTNSIHTGFVINPDIWFMSTNSNCQFDYWDRKFKQCLLKTQHFMSKRLGVIVMMLLLIASSAGVSASEQTTVVSNGGYHVEPVYDTDKNPVSIASVYSTITQSMTNWHQKTITGYVTSLNVDLNWGNPSNSLRLKIYSPDGNTFGPYYDSFDGAYDGRVNLNIINSAGIAKGTWHYEVYGNQVTGTQGYYI
jgi:hypothetical protein